MRVARAPHTEIHDRATKTLAQELSLVRPHLPHLWDEDLPRLFEIPSFEIIDTIRMPERGAQSKESVITDVEIVIARPAMKKMIAICDG